MHQAAVTSWPDQRYEIQEIQEIQTVAPAVPQRVSPEESPRALSIASTWGTPLAPGQAFNPGAVGAVIVKSEESGPTSDGLFIWAMPGQYFDTTPGGVRIRLRRLVGPRPTESDPIIAKWNAVGQVTHIVTAAELRNRHEDVSATIRHQPNSASYSLNQTSQPNKASGRSFWLQGLVAVALLAAIVVTYLVETRSSPAAADQWLLALIGLGGLVIFGVAAMAIMQAAATS